MANDVEELIHVIQPEDHHEGAIKLRVIGARSVAGRFRQIEIQREQRGEQVVLEARDLIANAVRKERIIKQIEKCLVRVER